MKNDIRHVIRRFVPRALYQRLRHAADTAAIVSREGVSTLRQLRTQDDNDITLALRSLSHPFRLRRSPHHIDGVIQNVLRREYDRWIGDTEPTVIIDAGAYIGDLTCHWATRFPKAKLFALEPNPASLEYARTNLEPYHDRIVLIRAGLGAEAGYSSLIGSEMGSQLVKTLDPNAGIQVTTIPRILSEHNIHHVDILKLDIEGSEAEVIENADEWIAKVSLLVVEFHGESIERAAISKLSGFGFGYRRHRSLLTFSRQF